MAIRGTWLSFMAGGALLLAGCGERESGPIAVSAIGDPPALPNPNRDPLGPPAEWLLMASAQGLVRLDAGGQVEPALAQSWTVSDDGLRYTFRIARGKWPDGRPITAQQVVGRLRAAMARSSRNRLKPLLGSIAEIERMTESVLEITLKAPRPNFLQLLAQPDLAIVRDGAGTGPYRAELKEGVLTLEDARADEEGEEENRLPELVLRGESAALAVARFAEGEAHLVTGGTAGDLPVARAAPPPGGALRFDPVNGLFGLAVGDNKGPLRDAAVRRALAMAIDRPAIVAALAVPDLQPRQGLVPAGMPELPNPAAPDWAANPLPMRRSLAAQAVADAREDGDAPLAIRVAMPEGPGYRLIFAHLRRDWRAIGVDARAVALDAKADLRLIDSVAPAAMPAWYLRQFTCAASAICSAEADAALEAARNAKTFPERQAQLAAADRLIVEAAAFIPIAAPVRWSLVSQRLTGFQPNPFGRRFPGSLVAPPR